MTGRKKRMHTIRLSMESRKTIFRIETLSEEINPEWTLVFHRIFKDKLITYLEEQENGSYIFHYAGFTDTVSKEDVESGMYEDYPIIKYNKK